MTLMKKILFAFCLITDTLFSFAQNAILQNQVDLGYSSDGTVVKAAEYKLPYRIYSADEDTVLDQIVLVLRSFDEKHYRWQKDGVLMNFDLRTRKAIWQTDISEADYDIRYTKNYIILCTADGSYIFDRNTGMRLVKLNDYILYADRVTNIGFVADMKGIDLNNGHILWEKDIPTLVAPEAMRLTGDTMLVIKAGLHKFNIHTGGGWDIEGSNTAVDKMDGLLYHDLNSNVELSENNIFMADGQNIMCVTRYGKKIWSTSIEDYRPGNSSLNYNSVHNTLTLVNYGIASVTSIAAKNSKAFPHRYGLPFIARFDALTGKMLYIHEFGYGKLLYDDIAHGDTVIARLDGNVFVVFDAANGNILREVSAADLGLKKNPLMVTAEDLFIVDTTRTLHRLPDMYPNGYFVENDSTAEMLFLNSNFKIIGKMLLADIWQEGKTQRGFTAYRTRGKLMLARDNKRYCEIDMKNPRISGNYLLDMFNDKLRVVDLKTIN